MSALRRSIGLAIVASLVIALDAASAQQPSTQLIVFESLRTGDAEVWSAAPDGTRQRNVSRSPDTEDATPALSPDGAQVAFVRSTGSRNALWIMDAQGGVQRPLGQGSGSDFNPAWSPDGSRIAWDDNEHVCYDITGGERVALGHVVALVRDRIPDADIELGPGELAACDRQDPIVITAADRELGYRPRWGLARGIDDYCTWRESSDTAPRTPPTSHSKPPTSRSLLWSPAFRPA